MIDTLINYADKLSEEKGLSKKVKTLLSFVFVGSMTSFLFERFYFNYELIPLDDYANYYEYIIKGEFIVPFSIFCILWYLTDFVAEKLFTKGNNYFKNIVINKIISLVTPKNQESKFINTKREDLLFLVIKESKANWFNELLKETKKSKSAVNYATISSLRTDVQLGLQMEFTLLFRAIIAIAIYFIIISYFGWVLFMIAIVAILLHTLFISGMYLFMDLLSTIFKGIDSVPDTIEEQDKTEDNTISI